MKKRFSEEQINKILKEHETGISAQDICRKHGISLNTLYRWRTKYGGMELSDIKKLIGLEDENSKLKKLLAEIMLENQAIKAVLEKKW